MTDFLSNTNNSNALSEKIKEVLKGGEVRIASAFLGVKATTLVPGNARLICDIGMGGTSAKELEKLSTHLGDNLRYQKQFHPKIYISDKGAVVGSANLSNNGIGIFGDGKLSEAGVFFTKDSPAYHDAEEWFEECWKAAKPVNEKAINTAKLLWNRPPPGAKNRNKAKDFFSAIRSKECDLNFDLTNTVMDPAVKEVAEAEEKNVKQGNGIKTTDEITYFANMQKRAKSGKKVISFFFGPRHGILEIAPLQYLETRKVSYGRKTTDVSYFRYLSWEQVGLTAPTDAEKKIFKAAHKCACDNHPDDFPDKTLKRKKFLKFLKLAEKAA